MASDNTVLETSIDLLPNFQEIAQETLLFLQKRLGFSLWMVTRRENDDWIVLAVADSGYGVKPHQVFCWSDSFCSRMVKGAGPQVAPDSSQVEAYATAPIGKVVKISAYIGLPLINSKGELFGTLCAIDPEPQPESILQELPLLQMQARLISSLIAAELNRIDLCRRLEQVHRETMTDSLTHLWNRRGWESMITAEEERCQTFGSPAGIVMVDLDNLKQINDACGHSAGDQLIILAARCIEQSVRATDKVARLGGDEFAILTVEVAAEVVPQMAERIETSLAQQGIAASVGWAVRRSQATLKEALERADQHMYEVKRIHKQQTMAQVGLLFCKILQEQNYRATE